jgi:L-threonylcarbamoyladenylate synthase
VTVERIESLLGMSVSRSPASEVRAPGMLASHYAPRARVEVMEAGLLIARARELTMKGERVALLLTSELERDSVSSLDGVILLDLGASAEVAAQRLYASLRAADAEGASVVLASRPAAGESARGLGEALADRLQKAAGPR